MSDINYEDDHLDYLNDADYVYEDNYYEEPEPDDPFYFDEGETDPRVNPCPECPYGEVIYAYIVGIADYVCSAGCGWSA